MKIRRVELEPLPREDGAHLYIQVFHHLASIALHGEKKTYPEGFPPYVREIVGDDRVPCEWCMGTGQTFGYSCYICGGMCERPTERGMRRLVQKLTEAKTAASRDLAATVGTRAHLFTMGEDRYQVFREDMQGQWEGAGEMKPTLAEELADLEEAITMYREAVEATDAVLEETENLRRTTRAAVKAVSYRVVTEVVDEEAEPAPAPATCKCGKPPAVWDGGVPYCKKHAHARGLLRAPEPDPVPDTTPAPEAPHGLPQRRVLTRPMRLVGGPNDGELAQVERGEATLVIEGAAYERRGHVFEYVGEKS